ncbi:MAG: hypothetical protein H8E40_09660 [Chloroflexi bacterium]|nr:hypothetical protein [Chloroflexota bacterium]
MHPTFELKFEIEPIVPDTLVDVKSQFQAAIAEAIAESQLDRYVVEEPRATFEQHLPLTKEQVEIATLILAFAIREGPKAWEIAKHFFTSLKLRLQKKPPKRVDFTVKIGNREISAKGLSLDDAVKVIIEKYEVELRPRKRR